MNLLTNICEYSEAHLTEAMTQQMKRLQGKKNYFLYGAIGLLLVYSLFMWIIRKEQNYLFYGLLALAMAGVMYFNNRSLPRRTARLQVARIREKGSGLEFRFCFEEEAVTIQPLYGGDATPVPYRSISSMVRTEHLILLFTEERQMLLLDPDRFDGGTETEFLNLAQQRFPRALPKVKGNG